MTQETQSTEEDLDYYFDSYAHVSIHRIMLSDKIRTVSYREAVFRNPSIFKDKVILDVGCGTGIISLFAAKCGAKRVYAVEKSSISKYANQIFEKNGFSDKIILIKKLMEEVDETDIPEKIDVIVSEWMGFCLLYESMLPSVIYARDKFMKSPNNSPNISKEVPITYEKIESDKMGEKVTENIQLSTEYSKSSEKNDDERFQTQNDCVSSNFGTMFPSRARLYITAMEDSNYYKRKICFWDDLFGFNFRPIKEWAILEPLIETCPEKQIITDDSMLIEFDLNHVCVQDLSFSVPFKLNPLEPIEMHAFVVWFDVFFDGPEATILLSTSPFEQKTHWAQTVFYLEKPIKLEEDSMIEGMFEMHPNQNNPRDQDISIKFKIKDQEYIQYYKIR